MGVVMVLLHAHIESGLKRIFKATRPGTLNGVGWEPFLEAYSLVGIDLTTKPHYVAVDAIRNLSNCYKHDAGRPKEVFNLPDGTKAEVGRSIDYSTFDFLNLADTVVEFLKAVGTDANNPHCPRNAPRVSVEILGDGTHRLSRVLSFLDARRTSHFDIEVKRMIGDGTMKKPRQVGVLSGRDGTLELPGVPSGVKSIYWLRSTNSRGEFGESVRVVEIQP
ncbi:MAG: hypothetical protein HUU52_06640 [Armatimonadetes bacterium]|nr:hypothetical protein [Armatimonadota bacterium]